MLRNNPGPANWRTRKEEVLLLLKKGGDISAAKKALAQAVEVMANISALVPKRSLEIMDLIETVEKEEVVAPPRCLTCTDKGKKDVAHVTGSGFCPVFRKEHLKLRGGK